MRQFYLTIQRQQLAIIWAGLIAERQINSLLYNRLAKSKDKEGLLSLAKDEQKINKPEDAIKEPLFVGRYGARLKTLDIYRICQRVLKQALAFLPEQERFHFTPHKLRHTFLKKVTDKHGVHFVQEMSDNVSIRKIFRYAKPSQEEMHETIEKLFES